MMPPPKLFYQVLPPPAKLPCILPPIDPPCPMTGGEVQLPKQVLTAKQGERTKAVAHLAQGEQKEDDQLHHPGL